MIQPIAHFILVIRGEKAVAATSTAATAYLVAQLVVRCSFDRLEQQIGFAIDQIVARSGEHITLTQLSEEVMNLLKTPETFPTYAHRC